MKKLTLNLDGIGEMLTKEQMKKISGGYTWACGSPCALNQHCSAPGLCFNHCVPGPTGFGSPNGPWLGTCGQN